MSASRTGSKKVKPPTQQELKRQAAANRIAGSIIECFSNRLGATELVLRGGKKITKPALTEIVEAHLRRWTLFYNKGLAR